MKTISRILMILTIALLSACEGEQGPPGIPGEDGLDGYNILGTVFEREGSFSSSNDYLLYWEFPSNFTVYDGDVVMVYILWEVNNNLDVWRALPQTIFFDQGLLVYSFDYTLADLQIFLEGPMDFSSVDAIWTDNQVFRIAVIPADLAQNKSLDITDYTAVMKALNRPTDPKDMTQIMKF